MGFIVTIIVVVIIYWIIHNTALFFSIIAVIAIIVIAAVWTNNRAEAARSKAVGLELEKRLTELGEQIEQKETEIVRLIQRSFRIEPCPRCHELENQLNEVSPNSRSVRLECTTCGRKYWAAAISPDGYKLASHYDDFLSMADEVERLFDKDLREAERVLGTDLRKAERLGADLPPDVRQTVARLRGHLDEYRQIRLIHFEVPEGPMPFEQTTRETIPESIRATVWRRDGGACVQCDSKEHLQFDHIIPVSKGGATSTVNLQLLCRACNLKKTNVI